ncbi:trans-1,2-dihydrobenzene-1,2-diol dehydrogenase-like [Ruditapes philippinarum]|uniref:trans-1,2-dihydrobenzene-1,2-diol dehydrogenase-like n=1 Tax=Ruditapes philippinarum TaxID=129788 RepID=UPI00295C2CC8|nr:trans-1,2-dihydrobenzene-1,2-diol dehydrogenase-like [Ruditapes philippinarum]
MATKWGCVGPGKISWDFFLAIQDNLPKEDHEFVAVGSRDLTRAQAFAEKFSFKKSYGSYDELASDKDVEVVYIGTVHTSHAELSIKMLSAGKHVICEKPMGMNYKQVKQVLDVAKKNNVLFVEGVWSRWFPVYEKIREELVAGSIGDPRLVQANFCVPIIDIPRIRDIKVGGGGALDIGIYVIQFAVFVFKEMPQSITAVGNLRGDVDESACIILKYKNGAMANLTYHTDAGKGDNNASILGKTGRIEVQAPMHCPTTMTSVSGTSAFPLKDADYFHTNSAGLQYEAAAVRECIRKGVMESDNYTHAEIEIVHQIMDEVRKQIGMKYPDFD